MKKYLIMFLLVISLSNVQAQNDLYLIFDVNEPIVTKNVYKYKRNSVNNPSIKQCGVFKINDGYYFNYPIYYGLGLELGIHPPNTPFQTMTRTQATALYPNAMNAAQLDAAMQVHIDYDYTHPLPTRNDPRTSATVGYFRSFDNIYVIEYLPRNQVKVVKVLIATWF